MVDYIEGIITEMRVEVEDSRGGIKLSMEIFVPIETPFDPDAIWNLSGKLVRLSDVGSLAPQAKPVMVEDIIEDERSRTW